MTMMVANGEILMAAATCPPATINANLFKTLLRVRQAEFEAQAGVNNRGTPALQSLVFLSILHENSTTKNSVRHMHDGVGSGSTGSRCIHGKKSYATTSRTQNLLKRDGLGSRSGSTSTSANALSPEPSSVSIWLCNTNSFNAIVRMLNRILRR